MRKELENIRRVERYLHQEMLPTEKAIFEKELRDTPELQAAVHQIEMITTAVKRRALRKVIQKNAPGKGGFSKGILISGIVITCLLGVAGVYWANLSSETAFEDGGFHSIPSLEKVDQRQTGEEFTYVDHESTSQTNSEKERKDQYDQLKSSDSTLGGKKVWAAPEIQGFEFKNEEGATIQGKDGTVIFVPDSAFVDENGAIVLGDIHVELVEALSIKDIVLYDLKTVSNGSPLESGGMFHLAATSQGEQVFINPQRPLYIEIPTYEHKPGMMAFQGEVDSVGNVNWVNPKPLKKYLAQLPLESLDFLPPDFESTLKSLVPFSRYSQVNKSFTDSIYYSLKFPFDNNANKESVRNVDAIPFVTSVVDTNRRIQLEDSISRDVIAPITRNRMLTEAAYPVEAEIQEVLTCGIDPLKIQTIKTTHFSKTYISTAEFEERVQVLHKIDNGNALLDIYINHLEQDLWIADSLVALELTGENQVTFKQFAAEKLTTIKDQNIHQDQINGFYRKKRKELEKYNNELLRKASRQNMNELKNALFKLESTTLRQKSVYRVKDTTLVKSIPRKVYAMPWYSLGWGNIDMYFKELRKGSVDREIVVTNVPQNVNNTVSLWLQAANTYTDLRKNGQSYTAKFPKRKTTRTHLFSIAKQEDVYYWGVKNMRIEGSKVKSANPISLSVVKTSIEEIKKDLQFIDASFGQLQHKIAAEEDWAAKVLRRQIKEREQREIWLKEREDKLKEFNEIVKRQKEEEVVRKKLREVAFICSIEAH